MTRVPHIEIFRRWEVLGPFQIGTREAVWGADPLECLGGFRSLEFDPDASYPSSLGTAGFVKWKALTQTPQLADGIASSDLVVAFPEIDWEALRAFYGWAALQYQAWTRGTLNLHGEDVQSIAISVDNVLEFWLDGCPHFGGDFYGFGRAPLILPLSPGKHRLDIRLIRDVRAMGAVGDPSISITTRVSILTDELFIASEKVLIPEIVEGQGVAGKVGSIPIRNQTTKWMDILCIELQSTGDQASLISRSSSVSLAPGQSRPLAVSLSIIGSCGKSLTFRLKYATRNSSQVKVTQWNSCKLVAKNISDPHRMTFLHPSGTVSYAILRAPAHRNRGTFEQEEKLPVLINLHGAGLEADSDQVRHMLDSIQRIEAWVLFPTGVTRWSGDDWHTWGFADVIAATNAISSWIETTSWTGPGVNLDAWYVVGHSNGGQGTWFALTHEPDKVKGAAPVSAYSSIQSYVPYSFWHELDPRMMSIIHQSLSSYRHELLLDNAKGIPIQQQHGSDDDNVPVFHSRRTHQLLWQSGNLAKYEELEGKGHWYDGLMAAPALRAFYKNISSRSTVKETLPKDFSIVIPCTGIMGSRGGIFVEQLYSPDQQGRINVHRDKSGLWELQTSNIRRLRLDLLEMTSLCATRLSVDGWECYLDESANGLRWLLKSLSGSWTMHKHPEWNPLLERFGAQLGNIEAILRTNGVIAVQFMPGSILPIASQVARNLYQYFGANCAIAEYHEPSEDTGNVINIALGLPKSIDIKATWDQASFPITITENGIEVDSVGQSTLSKRIYHEPGLGALFLYPKSTEELELRVWGLDAEGLRLAVRLIPSLTGVGQPDFVIVGKESAWKGASGARAMGFFDSSWQISKGSYLS